MAEIVSRLPGPQYDTNRSFPIKRDKRLLCAHNVMQVALLGLACIFRKLIASHTRIPRSIERGLLRQLPHSLPAGCYRPFYETCNVEPKITQPRVNRHKDRTGNLHRLHIKAGPERELIGRRTVVGPNIWLHVTRVFMLRLRCQSRETTLWVSSVPIRFQHNARTHEAEELTNSRN